MSQTRTAPPSPIYWTRKKTGAWPFPRKRARARTATLFFRGLVPGRGARAACRRAPSQSVARAHWRAASSPFGVWLYVAREWRQNSNEQEQLEARLLPASSQVRPGGIGRPGTESGLEFCSAGRPELMAHSRSLAGWLAGVWRELTPSGRRTRGKRNWRAARVKKVCENAAFLLRYTAKIQLLGRDGPPRGSGSPPLRSLVPGASITFCVQHMEFSLRLQTWEVNTPFGRGENRP